MTASIIAGFIILGAICVFVGVILGAVIVNVSDK